MCALTTKGQHINGVEACRGGQGWVTGQHPACILQYNRSKSYGYPEQTMLHRTCCFVSVQTTSTLPSRAA